MPSVREKMKNFNPEAACSLGLYKLPFLGGSQAKYSNYRKMVMLSQPSSARSNSIFISPDKKKKNPEELKITLCHSIFCAPAIDSYIL